MRAVIFDCDGVLINSEELSLGAALAYLAEIGLPFARADYVATFLGMTTPAHHAALEKVSRARHGRGLPAGSFAALEERSRAAVDEGLSAIAGVEEIVRALDLPKAVASGSAPARLAAKLRKVGLYDDFAPHIYSAEGVARGKPAPDIYLHAAAALGIEPEACLAVEDSVNGVTSARAAGMVVMGFTGGGHCPPQQGEILRAAGAAHVAASMDHLMTILRGMP